MNKDYERYHCQIALPGFGERAQQLLGSSRVLVVGIGGLGCTVAQYLTASGVGFIGIADDDRVSSSNLHRQILYTPQDIGQPKVRVALKQLKAQNPDTNFITYEQLVSSENVMELIAGFDLIIDTTDNFPTKYLLNDACVLSHKPLVYGAIYQYEGQVSIWNVLQQDGTYSANYRDVFPGADNAELPNCAQGGVMPTLAGIVGCMQANEAIKHLTRSQDMLAGKLWMIDLRQGTTRIIRLPKESAVKITRIIPSVPTISLAELQRWRKGNRYELIDVRSPEEHLAQNIGGRNIPLAELDNFLESHPISATAVFYCASGVRSEKAVRIFRERFPKTIAYSLKRG